MLGHLGFSYVGFIYLLMLIIPNLIWAKNQPKGYEVTNESKVLGLFERLGQALVTGTALIFSDYNLRRWSVWNIWLIISIAFMVMYECWWIKYFKSEKTLKDFYSGYLGVPLAGATLPVLGFLFLGIYGRVIWLIISVIIFGIGHIGIHIQHKRLIK